MDDEKTTGQKKRGREREKGREYYTRYSGGGGDSEKRETNEHCSLHLSVSFPPLVRVSWLPAAPGRRNEYTSPTRLLVHEINTCEWDNQSSFFVNQHHCYRVSRGMGETVWVRRCVCVCVCLLRHFLSFLSSLPRAIKFDRVGTHNTVSECFCIVQPNMWILFFSA